MKDTIWIKKGRFTPLAILLMLALPLTTSVICLCALIEFNNGKTSQNSYYSNVYGWDMGQDRDAVAQLTSPPLSTFSIDQNELARVAILTLADAWKNDAVPPAGGI